MNKCRRNTATPVHVHAVCRLRAAELGLSPGGSPGLGIDSGPWPEKSSHPGISTLRKYDDPILQMKKRRHRKVKLVRVTQLGSCRAWAPDHCIILHPVSVCAF